MTSAKRLLTIHRSCAIHGEQYVPIVRKTRINCCPEMDTYTFLWVADAAKQLKRSTR